MLQFNSFANILMRHPMVIETNFMTGHYSLAHVLEVSIMTVVLTASDCAAVDPLSLNYMPLL